MNFSLEKNSIDFCEKLRKFITPRELSKFKGRSFIAKAMIDVSTEMIN